MRDKIINGRIATDIETLLMFMRDDKSYSIAQLAGFIEEAIKARPTPDSSGVSFTVNGQFVVPNMELPEKNYTDDMSGAPICNSLGYQCPAAWTASVPHTCTGCIYVPVACVVAQSDTSPKAEPAQISEGEIKEAASDYEKIACCEKDHPFLKTYVNEDFEAGAKWALSKQEPISEERISAIAHYTTSAQVLEAGVEYKIIHEFKSDEFRSGTGFVIRCRREDDPEGDDPDVAIFDKGFFKQLK